PQELRAGCVVGHAAQPEVSVVRPSTHRLHAFPFPVIARPAEARVLAFSKPEGHGLAEDLELPILIAAATRIPGVAAACATVAEALLQLRCITVRVFSSPIDTRVPWT